MAVFVKEVKKSAKKAAAKEAPKAAAKGEKKSAPKAKVPAKKALTPKAEAPASAVQEFSDEELAQAVEFDEAVSALLAPVPEATYISKETIAERKSNRKSIVIAKAPQRKLDEIDSKKSVAFALSIAKEMKQRTREKSEKKEPGSEIRLARRPTTRERGQNTERFPEADLQEFRKRLLDAREKMLGGLDALKATGFNEAEDHEADGGDGTNQTLRLQALGQMGALNRTIQQIEEALHRIDDGSYGVCTICGQLIRKPRLVNQPFVLTCMECQNEMEKEKNR